ncbi:c-type cytochrome [Akkermansiaceae bacterium]|nr:c-type cytochrome [Akkermansiaceae bacterium]
MMCAFRIPRLARVALLVGLVGLSQAQDAKPGCVIDADTGITLPEGFDAEILYEVPKSQGSWVAMAFDPKGRLIVSDQDSEGVFRVTLPGEGKEIGVESLQGFPYEPIKWGKRTVGGALGFLHAFDSLYMTTMTGFYRCRDTDGDDQYDEFKLIKKLQMGYEHSAHSVIKSEDGKALYLVSGNYGRIPKGIPSRQPPVWEVDSLLHPMPDAMGHAVSIKPPGGWVCRISPDGEDWEMIASGFRNPVDLAINREGELFTFDSDLEFDVGSPWYRPTRINHVVSGGEFGWRSGTAKWREYFADSNGSVLNVGPGSPTGLSFGHHSLFPPEYRDKLFVCDWTFGTIFTVDLEEKGSSYVGTKKEFLSGTPLNITAMRFGPDGQMYFLTGGRNTDSKLYRINYTGPQVKGTVKSLKANQGLRDLRHELETFHGSKDGGELAVKKAWPYLSHEDRNIRYAARIAIENQEIDLWKERALKETNPRAVIYGSIAFSRHGEPSLGRLLALNFDSLEKEDRLAWMRAVSLCFIRLGEPTGDQAGRVIKILDPHFPAKDEDLNSELCRVLSFLNAPSVVQKTIALMSVTKTKAMAYDKEMLSRHEFGQEILKSMANTPNVQNIHYAYCLRRVQAGWTLESRKFYFSWLNDTMTKSGGKSFVGSIRGIREDAIKHLAKEDAAAVSWLLGEVETMDLSKLPLAKGPPVAWTVDSAMELFKGKLSGRDFENGKKMFSAGRCIACHRFQGEGGYSGPDLGSVGQRFSIRDMLVSICEPSDSVSEQYYASTVSLKSRGSLYGRVIYKNDKEIAVAQNPFNLGELVKKPIESVTSIEPSQISMMPPGMIASMNKEELKDLMAYLVSGGNKKHAVFQKK